MTKRAVVMPLLAYLTATVVALVTIGKVAG
jgi:hypothetical protein